MNFGPVYSFWCFSFEHLTLTRKFTKEGVIMALDNTQYYDITNKSTDKRKMAEKLTMNASIKPLSVPTEKVLDDDYLLEFKRYFQIICPDKVVKRLSNLPIVIKG